MTLLYLCNALHYINRDFQTGHIALLIPRNFCGALQLSTRDGSLNFLPALEGIMKVLKVTGRETLILVGEPNSLQQSSSTIAALPDFCQLGSRSGNVTVGFSGEDSYVAGPGVWRTLLNQFSRKNRATTGEVPHGYYN